MQPNQLSMSFWITTGTAGFLVVLALVCMAWQKPTSLVVVDMNRAIQAPSLMLAHSKHSKAAQLQIMRRFSALLPDVITAYGQEHHVTVVSAPVLSSNSTLDITNVVVSRTIARMKHEA